MPVITRRSLRTYLRPINLFVFLQILIICFVGCYKITFKVEDAPRTIFNDGVITGIPGFDSAMQTQEEKALYPPVNVALAMDIFYIEWYATFGDPGSIVADNLNHMFIEWTEEKDFCECFYCWRQVCQKRCCEWLDIQKKLYMGVYEAKRKTTLCHI